MRIAYCVLGIAYCVLRIASWVLRIACWVLGIACWVLCIAYGIFRIPYPEGFYTYCKSLRVIRFFIALRQFLGTLKTKATYSTPRSYFDSRKHYMFILSFLARNEIFGGNANS